MSDVDYIRIGERAVARARKWVKESTKYPEDTAAKLLAKTLKDPSGLDFTVSFVDGVIRPEDIKVAADSIVDLSKNVPGFLPPYLRMPMKLGSKFAPVMPSVVVPAARKVFQQLVGDLVLNVSEKKLGKAIAKLRAEGARLNMNLLGEAVLGDAEAHKRLQDTMDLLKRDDVDYVSLKVSAVTGPHNPWAYDTVVNQAVEALLPLYLQANSYEPKKFVNLDMEEYHDLHLTIDVFTKILDRPELKNLSAGIVLQAYLPDALPAMQELQAWAKKRVDEGGAPIKVRVVKGANLSMETVDAKIHGWPLTTQPTKQATDANYIRVLDYALRKEHTRNIRIGVAGMNLFTVAMAFELALERGVFQSGGVEFEMLSGMAAPQAKAVAEDVGPLLFYVPVVHPEEYDVAIAYLVRRLEENAASQNFMSSVFELATDGDVLLKEQYRFQAALEDAFTCFIGSNRTQDRLHESEKEIASVVKDSKGNYSFNNTPDSDPALPNNRQWARNIVKAIDSSKLGVELVKSATVTSETELNKIVKEASAAGKKWAEKSAAERAEILHKAGIELGKRRAEFIEVAASECGKTVDQSDVEVSEAIDFAHYYAQLALDLQEVEGAKFEPIALTVVTPPWNFPTAIPAGSTLAALAAGSAVILKPAGPALRTGAVLAEALWAAGVPKDVLRFINIGEKELGKQLITNPLVDQVILTGGIETAELFRSWRKDLPLLAETSGKNAIIVTPHADLDLAVKDVVASAFGHAGQKCSASSLVILVGSVGRSRRFHGQLVDAVKSLEIGYPTELSTQMGPLTTPASGKLLRGLTTLGKGESWVIKPKQLDESGKLWSPGVRANVQPYSEYHLTEYFGPILGVMRVDTLEEAIELQNATDYGLTAGLHSLNAEEINLWLDKVQAGNIYINRGITGAIVRRQPFGGWKLSAVGNGTKAGGPSYLFSMGKWSADKRGIENGVALSHPVLKEADKVADSFDAKVAQELHDSFKLDQKAYNEEYGVGHDPSQIGIELNVLRYLPLPVLVRLNEKQKVSDLLRVVAAGLAVGSKVSVSSGEKLPVAVAEFFNSHGVKVTVESDEQFLNSVASWKDTAGLDGRIRLIGSNAKAVAEAVDGSCTVAIYANPVTYSGRVEMLPFVHEQAVSFTNHRFGNPTPLTAKVNL